MLTGYPSFGPLLFRYYKPRDGFDHRRSEDRRTLPASVSPETRSESRFLFVCGVFFFITPSWSDQLMPILEPRKSHVSDMSE